MKIMYFYLKIGSIKCNVIKKTNDFFNVEVHYLGKFKLKIFFRPFSPFLFPFPYCIIYLFMFWNVIHCCGYLEFISILGCENFWWFWKQKKTKKLWCCNIQNIFIIGIVLLFTAVKN